MNERMDTKRSERRLRIRMRAAARGVSMKSRRLVPRLPAEATLMMESTSSALRGQSFTLLTGPLQVRSGALGELSLEPPRRTMTSLGEHSGVLHTALPKFDQLSCSTRCLSRNYGLN